MIGICVDAHGECAPEQIPELLLNKGNGDLEQLYHVAKRLCGEYCIVYKNAYGMYILPDATAMLQINYVFCTGKMYASSNARIIAQQLGLEVACKSKEIYAKNMDMKIFPSNITAYDEIKVLLPNRYLDWNNHHSEWFGQHKKIKCVTNDAIGQAIENCKNVVHQYLQQYDIACPLTGGLDTRLNLSFIHNEGAIVLYYTVYFGTTASVKDVEGAGRIAQQQALDYCVYPLQAAPDALKAAFYELSDYGCLIEEGTRYFDRTLNLAYTTKEKLSQKAILNGHIIDQIGKGGVLPCRIFLLPGRVAYFAELTRNRSIYGQKAYKTWLTDTKKCCDNIADRAALDIRCARWVSEAIKVFSLLGITMLKIYNCQETLELLMQIPRSRRKLKKPFHTKVLKDLFPSLPQIGKIGNLQYIQYLIVRTIKDMLLQMYLPLRFAFHAKTPKYR